MVSKLSLFMGWSRLFKMVGFFWRKQNFVFGLILILLFVGLLLLVLPLRLRLLILLLLESLLPFVNGRRVFLISPLLFCIFLEKLRLVRG